MKPLSQTELSSAAYDFRQTAAGESLVANLTSSPAELPLDCREAQNAPRSAIESAESAIALGTMVNRLWKVSEGKEVKGTWATPAQDCLRASVLFAGAGLDRALKRLADDALPALLDFDDEVNSKFTAFAEQAIGNGGSVNPKELVSLLLGRGETPRDTLSNRWRYELQSASAQSAERVEQFALALGVTDASLRKRIKPTPKKTSRLERAFSARNQIAHELDVTKPTEAVRQRLERIRRQRSVGDVREYVVEMLDVTQCVINDVAARLVANGAV
ncbi:hypothetical protein [Aeromicrobium sp. JJY06]|uniref:hypothetical protein n=1 Tax=Aeromicrobium sp. JJY06 TaxID=3373478 RepID=UPI00376EB462